MCINGRFYPVREGVARVPRAHLTEEFGVTVHAADGRRYRGDALAILCEDGKEVLVPLSDCESHLLLSLASTVAALEGRLTAAEAALAAVRKECRGTSITFGGFYES